MAVSCCPWINSWHHFSTRLASNTNLKKNHSTAQHASFRTFGTDRHGSSEHRGIVDTGASAYSVSHSQNTVFDNQDVHDHDFCCDDFDTDYERLLAVAM